jgi:hypothetical protein
MQNAPDPILALIEEHTTVLTRLNEPGNADTDDDVTGALSNDEVRLWKQIVTTKPKTLASLAVTAEHIASFPDLDRMIGYDGPALALATMAAALRDILTGTLSAKPKSPAARTKRSGK